MKTKLDHYILGLLIINPKTGYDIKKYLDTEGRFDRAKAPLSQIYTTLKRMTEKNLVIFVEEKRDGKPDLKIYSTTAKGRNQLIDFIHSPLKLTFRFSESSIVFRMKFAFLVEADVIIKQIQEELAYRQEQISKFRHRDRTVESANLSTAELAYVQAINDEAHIYGAARMDLFVDHLQKMLTFFQNQNEAVAAVGVA